jgi:hypothetical protein
MRRLGICSGFMSVAVVGLLLVFLRKPSPPLLLPFPNDEETVLGINFD